MEEPLLQNPVAIFLTIISIILVAPLLMERIHLPGIVGFIIGGAIVGPHGLNLLSTEYTISTLATVGLVYLMFSVGLEIDLRQFKRVRNASIALGALTFAVPEIAGTAIGRSLGFNWNSSIVLGAVIASHAVITYPILSRYGILRNDAVAATMGATIIADIAALLFLAYAVSASEQAPSALEVAKLMLYLAGYTALVLLVVPRLGKYFFRRFRGRAVEFQFILVVVFVAALLAELIDMHAIIGAFLAGLAINSALPSRSPAVDRVLFLGEAFFIPVFLVYIGMLMDPRVLASSSNVLLAGLMLTMAVYLTKLIPAWAVAFFFRYSRDELFTIWGISQAQAPATLAILLVGVEAGLLPSAIFNGGIIMVMITCVTSSIIVQRFGSRLAPSVVPEERGSRYKRILVATSNPQTQGNLLAMAGILARSADGQLLALHVTERPEGERYCDPEDMGQPVETEKLDDSGIGTLFLNRVDSTVANGILHSAMENRTTMIVLGWHGEKPFREGTMGGIIDRVLWTVEVPVLMGRINTPANAMKRLFFVVPANSVVPGMLEEILRTAVIMASSLNLPMMILCHDDYLESIREGMGAFRAAPQYRIYKLGRSVVRDVASRATPQDLVMVTTQISRLHFGSGPGRIPEQLAASTQASLAVLIHPA